jgi:hypothetical protein
MIKKVCLFLVVLFLFYGCYSTKIVETKNLGKITRVEVVPTSFTDAVKTMITTDKVSVVVYGVPPIVAIGEDLILTRTSSSITVTWESSARNYSLYY